MGLGGSKRVVTEGMSLQELAEVAIDDLQSSGARTSASWRMPPRPSTDGAGSASWRPSAVGILAMRLALYGLAFENRFYSLMYSAPERHYFALDVATFDELAQSFRVRPPAPAPQS
jgi:hypothetical protein